MKLGMSGQLLGSTSSLEDILKILVKHQLNSIEIWPVNIPAEVEGLELCYDTYEGRDIKRAKETLDRYEINVCCVSMPGGFNYELCSNAEKYTLELIRAVRVAKELGAKFVNHYCYNICLDEKPDLIKLKKYLAPVLEVAEEEGIILCLENEAHDTTRTPEGMLTVLESFNSDFFKTNFDATNYYHASQEGFPHGYEVLKKHIAYVHLKNGCIYSEREGHCEQSKGGTMTGHFAPNNIYYSYIEDGALNIDGLLMRLKRDGYDGYCVFEPHTTPDLAEAYYNHDIEYIKRRLEL